MSQIFAVNIIETTAGSFSGSAAINAGKITNAYPVNGDASTIVLLDTTGVRGVPARYNLTGSFATINAQLQNYVTGISLPFDVLSLNGDPVNEERTLACDNLLVAFPFGSFTKVYGIGQSGSRNLYILDITLANFITAIADAAAVEGGGHTIQDNGVDMPQRTNLNFIGFTVADDALNDATDVTSAGSGSVDGVTGTAPIVVDNTDPANPIVTLPADSVTNATLAEMATKTYKGRTSALTGNPEDVPVATVITDLGVDLKAPIASPTFTGTVTIPTPFTLGAVSVLTTGTELNFVDGVTSNIQTQLDSKGTGNVSKVGVPVDNQVGVWTGDGTIEGDVNLTFDTATDTLTTVNVNATTFTGALSGNAATVTTNANMTGPVTSVGNATSLAATDNGFLLSAAGADLSYSGFKISLTAGENLVAGDECYVKSDGKLWKSDADAIATMPSVFMSLATILADATGLFACPGGVYRNDALYAWTPGALLYASLTPGALQDTPVGGTGDVSQAVAIALTADKIYRFPSLAMGVVV